jgi:hypothetical protein
VLESRHEIPSVCNEQGSFGSGNFDPANPFTPDVLMFNKNVTLARRRLAKPTASGDLPVGRSGFREGGKAGRLFATDSNQAAHASGRIIVL